MDLSNCTALVVDDFSTVRRFVSNLLREAGFGHVAEAEDGTDALHRLDHDDVHFVVSDRNMTRMTGMTGIELLKAVRSFDKLKNLPLLLNAAERHKETSLKRHKRVRMATSSSRLLRPL